MKAEVLQARPEHAALIAARLSENSTREVERFGEPGDQRIAAAITRARYAWAGFINGEIICVWGIESETFISDTGTLWFISTAEVEKHTFLIVRKSKLFIEAIKEFSLIHGLVNPKFDRSIKWIKWLGFTIEPEQDGMRYFHKEIH